MNDEQSFKISRIIDVFIVLVFLTFIVRKLELSMFINSWGFDLLMPALVYFGVLSYWQLIFKGLAPRLLAIIIGVGSAILMEYFQLHEIQILVFPVGTFDYLDIVAFAISGVIAIILDTLLVRRLSHR